MRLINLTKCEGGQYREMYLAFDPSRKVVCAPVPEPNWFERVILWIAEPRNSGRLRGQQYEY